MADGQGGKYYPVKEFCFDGFCSRKTSCLFANLTYVLSSCWPSSLDTRQCENLHLATPQEVTYNFFSASAFLLPTDQGSH